MDFVAVPPGSFAFGLDPALLYPPEADETPRRVVRVDGFRISRLPVTDDDGVPLTYVSRADAETWCAANGVRLPTEIEWEAAARGGDDRLWPWGDELPDSTRAIFGRAIGAPSPAGQQPAGAAPCGALDLAGNVWEWTSDGSARGGSFLSGAGELRTTARFPIHPEARDPYVGFRVVAVEPTVELDWVDVPAGDYVLGRDPDESRQRLVDVKGFELGLTPVTNAEYEPFVAEGGAAAPPHWPAPPDHPVTFVDWHDASAFCVWVGGRLPTEVEWEKAARGTDGRTYPWGEEEDESRAAVGSGIKAGTTSPVGAHPEGASPYGLQDMAGNVWEWTATEDPPGERVLRGGSFASPGLAWATCTFHSHSRPGRRAAHVGFRVAREAT